MNTLAMNVRAGILAVTISLLIGIAAHPLPPSRLVQTDYCFQQYRAAAKNPVTGEVVFGWARGYAPCSQQDVYRQI